MRKTLHSIKQSTPPSYQVNTLVSNRQQVEDNILYNNMDSIDGINFNVARVPFKMGSIDPRILTIRPEMGNESHKHAHETFFYVLSGTGKCHINDKVLNIEQGSMVHVPRCVLHHTENTGTTDLSILEITDYGLTGLFSENTEQSYRNVPENLGSAVPS